MIDIHLIYDNMHMNGIRSLHVTRYEVPNHNMTTAKILTTFCLEISRAMYCLLEPSIMINVIKQPILSLYLKIKKKALQ